jgi:SAM-dependent methyltransferase/uncharacterized protein YbaR (Trm112 family)
MTSRLLDLLRCPKCTGSLTLKVYEYDEDSHETVRAGLLTCTACAMAFAIWQGIPRMNLEEDFRLPYGFVEEYKNLLSQDAPAVVSQKSKWARNPYDVSWSLDSDGEFAWGRLELMTRLAYFYHYLQVPHESLRGRLILDAGCGNGALSAAIARNGAEVVAFDYSDIVVRAAANNSRVRPDGKVHFLQADVRYPPFAEESFDAIYSDGVIHLSGNTRDAFHRIVRLAKPCGRVFVSVSRKNLSRSYLIRKVPTDILQHLFRLLPVGFSKPLCLAGAVVLSVYVRLMQMVGLKKKRVIGPLRHEALVLWHTIALPQHQYHVPEEIEAWFREEGFENVQETTIPSLSHTGFGMLGIWRIDSLQAGHETKTI